MAGPVAEIWLARRYIGLFKSMVNILAKPSIYLPFSFAIPVNNYASDFSISYSDNTQSVVSSYTNYNSS